MPGVDSGTFLYGSRCVIKSYQFFFFSGHPQIKVFVYHCGLNGIWEAVYHGVPIVAIPFSGDQFDNAQRVVSRGMGVKLDITTLTSDELAEAIRTVINDKRYVQIPKSSNPMHGPGPELSQ